MQDSSDQRSGPGRFGRGTVRLGNVVENQTNLGENVGMDRSRVIETLRAHQDELRAAGFISRRCGRERKFKRWERRLKWAKMRRVGS